MNYCFVYDIILTIEFATSTQHHMILFVIYLSSICLLSESSFVDPLAGLSESFTLLLIDFAQRLNGHLAGLSVSHTKHIVCLDSSVYTAVSWNWLTKLLYQRLCFGWADTKESGTSLGLRLWGSDSCFCSHNSLSISFLFI